MIQREYLPDYKSIVQLVKRANTSKIAQVCREMQQRRKPCDYLLKGEDSPDFLLLPTFFLFCNAGLMFGNFLLVDVAMKVVEISLALLTPFLQVAKRSVTCNPLPKILSNF